MSMQPASLTLETPPPTDPPAAGLETNTNVSPQKDTHAVPIVGLDKSQQVVTGNLRELILYTMMMPYNFLLEFLYFMVNGYDRYIYTPIQVLSTPVVQKIPRYVTIQQKQFLIFSANVVTVSRTLLAIPIGLCLRSGHYKTAFCLVVLHDYLDHLDGVVAKVHRDLGYKDDAKLGSFLDAICDKIVNILCMWSFILLVNFANANWYQVMMFLVVCLTIIGYEVLLAIVRVQDYCAATSEGEQRNLAANMEGKLKEKLESVGLALFCLGMPDIMNSTVGVVGLACFLLSACLAQSSLNHKLEARRTTTAAPTGNDQKQLVSNLTAEAKTDRYDKVYTIGCFDLLHRGHRNLFRTMRSIGDHIIVGVHSDESIFKLKNKWPTDPLAKRIQNVKKYADIVFAIPDTDPTPYILAAISGDKNSVFVRGDDMPNFPSRASVERHMDVRLIPYTPGISSTLLRTKLANGEVTPEQIAEM